ncbi:MAG: UTP--glucose-1-phosphate uridylyltransferase [Clostridia bacterium]|nr:UTP--glucose-1-phosphate uridylyltransferase [Clostridia bacterium]
MKSYLDETLEARLRQHGQAHLLEALAKLTEEERTCFSAELCALDFDIFARAKDFEEKSYETLAPMPIFYAARAEEEKDALEGIGLRAIAEGRIGAVLLCGGQGTRLGYPRAKGTFNIGLKRELPIFALHFSYLCEVAERAGKWFPVYIMTSVYNRVEIEDFLKERSFFGYDASAVRFFTQNMAPSTDFEGNIYQSSPSSLVLSPDGNGGWFSSLVSEGYLDEIKEQGVEWLNVIAIDNVLQKTADPRFIGAVIRENAACGAKVVKKADPDERIGLICQNNSRPAVIEYFELDRLKKEKAVSTEEMEYGVILNYLFRTDEMEKTLSQKLPVHKARKKIPYYRDGEYIKPETENGFKYEMLATDLVERMDSCLAYEIVREREFAPVKNRVGIDSVESARAMLLALGYEL